MACGMCPGFFEVYFWNSSAWERLDNVDSWSFDANVQEATKKRTSSTGGLAVKFCGDIVDYSASVTTTLCRDNWLFCDILAGSGQELGKTFEGWFFFSWGNTAGTDVSAPTQANVTALNTWKGGGSIVSHTDQGAYAYGKVVPPSFGGDNTSTDPSTASFTINLSAGPLLPVCSGEDYAP